MVRQQKGKTYEELFGIKKAIKLKQNKSQKLKGRNKGKTYEEIHGKEKAKKIKLKQKKNSLRWPKKKIKKNLYNIIKKIGPITRSDLRVLYKYYDICNAESIRMKFGSLDNLAIEIGIEFSNPRFRGRIGKNENKILNMIEKENNIEVLRQYYVRGKFVDGYDKENNIVYEVDEFYHKYRRIEDKIRENQIKEELNCKIIRIKDW